VLGVSEKASGGPARAVSLPDVGLRMTARHKPPT
jgi:hypothetical protein